jgi:hypothetical protein
MDAVPQRLDLTNRRQAPTEHRDRLLPLQVLLRQRDMPERQTTGIDGSLLADVHREARRHGAISTPVMAGHDLLERIENGMRQGEFDL